MTDVQRMIRTKTVKETFIEKGYFVLWKPRLHGERCECFLRTPDPNRLCRDCYGSGIVGGGFHHDPQMPVWFKDASFEEVVDQEVQEDTTVDNAPVELLDEFVNLTLECDFQYHIYKGCLFKLEGHYWKVRGVEELEESDEYGLPDNKKWHVACRKLQEYEGNYAFLRDHDVPLDNVKEPKVVQLGQIVWENICPNCKRKGSYNIDLANPPNQIVCSECSHVQTWGEFDGNKEE